MKKKSKRRLPYYRWQKEWPGGQVATKSEGGEARKSSKESMVRGNGLGGKEKELLLSRQADKWGLSPGQEITSNMTPPPKKKRREGEASRVSMAVTRKVVLTLSGLGFLVCSALESDTSCGQENLNGSEQIWD